MAIERLGVGDGEVSTLVHPASKDVQHRAGEMHYRLSFLFWLRYALGGVDSGAVRRAGGQAGGGGYGGVGVLAHSGG